MSWFKVDDKFHAHPKVKRIPRGIRRAAIGLWTLTGAWSADYQTDGEIPEYMLEELDAEPEEVDALVSVGLWEQADDGIVFVGWSEFQPTRAEQDAKRAATAERVRKHRQSKRNATETPVTSGESNGVTGALVTPVYNPPEPEPEPETEPEPIHTPPPLDLPGLDLEPSPAPSRKRSGASVYPDAFEEFWSAWPKAGDSKAAALKAWTKATRGNSRIGARIAAPALLESVRSFAEDPNIPPNTYIRSASRWLNEDGWTDGPLPARGGGRPSNLDQTLDVVAQMHAARAARQNTQQIAPPAQTPRRIA